MSKFFTCTERPKFRDRAPLSIVNCAKWPNHQKRQSAQSCNGAHERGHRSVHSQMLRMCREFLSHCWFLLHTAGPCPYQNRSLEDNLLTSMRPTDRIVLILLRS